MGSPTMSTQSSQTGGKSGQYGQPGQSASGKGMGSGMQSAVPSTDVTNALHRQNMQQVDSSDLGGVVAAPTAASFQNGASTQNIGSPDQPMGGAGSPIPTGTNVNQSLGSVGISNGVVNGASSQSTGSLNNLQPGMGQGNVTYPNQSGQPMMGMPNAYSNTVGRPGGMDNGSAYRGSGGKGAAGSNGKNGR